MWLCLKKYQEFFLPFYGHKLNDMQFLGCTLVGTALAMLTPTNFCEAEILSLFLKEKGLGICIFCLCACWDSPVSVCLSLPFFTCCPPQTAAWDLWWVQVTAPVWQCSLPVLQHHLPVAQPTSFISSYHNFRSRWKKQKLKHRPEKCNIKKWYLFNYFAFLPQSASGTSSLSHVLSSAQALMVRELGVFPVHKTSSH